MTTMTKEPLEAQYNGASLRGNRVVEYKCDRCGGVFAHRNALRAKTVRFVTIGQPKETVRTRTAAWLCLPCTEADPDWNLEPNYKNTKGGGIPHEQDAKD